MAGRSSATPSLRNSLLSLVRIWSASLVQVKGCQRWFPPSQNRRIAAISSSTLAKSPRRSAWRSMLAKDTSTSSARTHRSSELHVDPGWLAAQR